MPQEMLKVYFLTGKKPRAQCLGFQLKPTGFIHEVIGQMSMHACMSKAGSRRR